MVLTLILYKNTSAIQKDRDISGQVFGVLSALGSGQFILHVNARGVGTFIGGEGINYTSQSSAKVNGITVLE